jgi:hypothetical protein
MAKSTNQLPKPILQKKPKDKWIHYYLGGCTLCGVILASYIIKHPEIVHPNQKQIYENTASITPITDNLLIINATSIHDLNKDGVPELRVQYTNKSIKSIDTLFSHVENKTIYFK